MVSFLLQEWTKMKQRVFDAYSVTNQKYKLNQISVGTTLMKFHGRKSFLPVTQKKQVLKRLHCRDFLMLFLPIFLPPRSSPRFFSSNDLTSGRSSNTHDLIQVYTGFRCIFTTPGVWKKSLHNKNFWADRCSPSLAGLQKIMRWDWHDFTNSAANHRWFDALLFWSFFCGRESLRCVLGVSFKRSSDQKSTSQL